jgi:ribosome-associated protein
LIEITPTISIDENELEFVFVRSSGPGGQNVNKVATAVQLRFDVAASPSLDETTKSRLALLAGNRMTNDGVLIINARRHRTQERNREDAVSRFVGLVREASKQPKIRRKTKPSAASKERRLVDKHKRGELKRTRKPLQDGEE